MQNLSKNSIQDLKNTISKAADIEAVRPQLLEFFDTLHRAETMKQKAVEKLARSLANDNFVKSR
jgi:hypothetical protein